VRSRKATPRWYRKFTLAGLLVLLAAVAFLFFFHRGGKGLTNKDTVILADFTNHTGDPVFDETLQPGMTISLEQSPFLSLISGARIQQTLRLMGRSAGAPLTPEIARDICERTASAAVLEGSIASRGSHYVLGLRARRKPRSESSDFRVPGYEFPKENDLADQSPLIGVRISATPRIKRYSLCTMNSERPRFSDQPRIVFSRIRGNWI
jgi:hypothetical protein